MYFNKTPHILSDFSFQCIDQVQAFSDSDRIDKLLITKEAYWSAQLFPLVPFGLNKRQKDTPSLPQKLLPSSLRSPATVFLALECIF